jgi:putative phosphoribosyl transferase
MFNDRKDAAEKLGIALEKYRNMKALVLGIPRGGAETAYYVAKYLDAEMSLVVTRKLGYPANPEAAFGAVAEDGSLYISEAASQILSTETTNEVLKEQKREIQRRIQKLRKGKPLPDFKDRTLIIVDDGIATGATLFATIMLCKKRMAGKIVVAAPIAGTEMAEVLERKVDEVIILETPSYFRAVSQGYYDFSDLTDEEAVAFFEKWERERGTHS